MSQKKNEGILFPTEIRVVGSYTDRLLIACYESKGDLSPVMLKEIFHDNWEFRNYKDLYGKPCKSDWMAKVVFLIQMLPTFCGRCNCYFWDIRLKILRLPTFNIPFQLVLRQLNCFRVYRKLITWSSHAKGLLGLDKGYFDRICGTFLLWLY